MRLVHVVVAIALGGCHWVFGADVPADAALDAPRPNTWSSISTGDAFTCAIRLDGSLWCWGYNNVGQLGTGDIAVQIDVPTAVQPAATFLAVTTGRAHACALRDDHAIVCWGENWGGQLGVGDHNPRGVPTRVGVAAWKAVAAGSDHTCAIAMDDTVACWGYNSNGQLGDGSTDLRTVPTPISTPTTFTQLAAGNAHTCAIATDRMRWCWGDSAFGQFGNGTFLGIHTPTKIEDGHAWRTLVAGGFSTCGIDADGNGLCWGNNDDGQLGDGTQLTQVQPTEIAGGHGPWRALAIDADQACGVLESGAMYCWGNSIGNGLAAPSTTPLALPGATTWDTLALSATHVCRLGTDHTLWCAGDGSAGQLGDGTTAVTSPVQVSGSWSGVDAGKQHACGIDGGSRVRCWGLNDHHELADGTTLRRSAPAMPLAQEYSSLSAGEFHNCGVRTSGAVACWGTNFGGSIGDGTIEAATPTVVYDNVGMLSAGGFTLATLTTGPGLLVWGRNDFGQLGNGTKTALLVPTLVDNRSWTHLSAGIEHGCGITSNIVVCGGRNDRGQVGNPNAGASVQTWTAVQSTSAYRYVAAGSGHSCAITETDALHCWGQNDHRQLGTSSPGDAVEPTTVMVSDPAVGWRSVAPGARHTCGVRTDGTLYCWGENDRGQLGTGSFEALPYPMQVGDDTTWKAVTAGENFTCALKTDGTLWCWGDNRTGQLGNQAGWKSDYGYVP